MEPVGRDRKDPAWRRYLRFWGTRTNDDVDDELAFHIQAREDEYRTLGLNADQAHAEAIDRFGDVTRYRNETIAVEQGTQWRQAVSTFFTHLGEDLRYGARQLRRNRSLTFAAVGCLALGIGSSVAIFSVVNGVLFRSLPFAGADRMIMVSEGWTKITTDFRRVTPADVVDFDEARGPGKTLESLALLQSWQGTIVRDGDAELVPGAQVTPAFFDLLRVTPAMGRPFEARDVEEGAPLVTIITDARWRRVYGADPHIIGQRVAFASGQFAQIIGVMPASFAFPFSGLEMPAAEMLMPLGITPGVISRRGNSYDGIAIGKLNPGVSLASAQSALSNIGRTLVTRHPETYGRAAASVGQLLVHVIPLSAAVSESARKPLLFLLGAVGFLLLVACTNVASLFVVRAAARRREIAVRRALGATNGRLARQFFAEALILASVAGIAGLILANWGAHTLVALAPGNYYKSFDVGVDARVLALAVGVTVLTALVVSFFPAVTGGTSSAAVLRESERASAAPHRSRARRALIVAEIALALMLTVGAGLMVQSFARARAVDPGFDPTNVTTFRVSIPQTRYPNAASIKALELQLVDRLRRVPGVRGASAATPLPMAGNAFQITYTPQGVETSAKLPTASNEFVLPGFLETMGVRLQAGRLFTERDDGMTPRVVVVNETLARRTFGGMNAIGRQIKWGSPSSTSPWLTIVGIVGDVKHDRLDGPPQPSVYMPVLQQDSTLVGIYRFLSYVVRSNAEGVPSIRALRAAIQEIDPQLPVVAATSLDAMVGGSIATRRFNALLLALFSILALTLAATGVYGLLQYSVLQRTREIGVRVAIGASAGRVMRLVVGEAFRLAVIGVFVGALGAVAITRVMRDLLFETSTMDAASFAGAGAVLLLVALAASGVPARRAVAIDPAVAMRGD